MSAITAKASRKMKKYAVLTREPRCFLGSFDFSWEQRKLSEMCGTFEYGLNAAAKEFDGKNKYIRITDIDDASREFLLSDLSSPDICLDGMSKYLLSSGDIVFARTGASVGKTYIYRENDGIVYFAGFLIRAKVNQDNDAEFVFQSTLSPSYEKYIRITSQRSGQPGVNAQEYGEYDLFAPSKEEQQRIGHFLRGIDNLITLHQRKCANLCSPSQVVFSLLFATSTFSWEQRKLGDVVKEIIRNDPESEAPIMMITANNGFIEQSERYAFNNAGESLKKYILLKKGELAYNHGASKLRPYGSCFALTTAENARIPFVYHCFSAENQNAEFMSIKLNGAEIENQLRKIVSSGARMDGLLNISFDEYTSVSVLLPGTEEQDRIADFFRHLENLITLHQRKFEKLTNVKKSMLEKMFPQNGSSYPEIRFKGFTDPWEQRKLGEASKRVIVGLATSVTPYYRAEGVPILRNLNIKENYLDDSDILFLDRSYAESQISKQIRAGDVLTVHTGYIGTSCVVPEKYDKCLTFTTLITTTDNSVLKGEFLAQYLNSDIGMSAVQSVTTQGGRQNLNTNDFVKVEIRVPSLLEQSNICAMLRNIDNLITLHQRQPFFIQPRIFL